MAECYRLREELLGALAVTDEVAVVQPSIARRVTAKSYAAARFATMTTVGAGSPPRRRRGSARGQPPGWQSGLKLDDGASADAKEASADARQRAEETRPGEGVAFFDNINAEPCGFFFDA